MGSLEEAPARRELGRCHFRLHDQDCTVDIAAAVVVRRMRENIWLVTEKQHQGSSSMLAGSMPESVYHFAHSGRIPAVTSYCHYSTDEVCYLVYVYEDQVFPLLQLVQEIG